jgi:hypothetical protein
MQGSTALHCSISVCIELLKLEVVAVLIYLDGDGCSEFTPWNCTGLLLGSDVDKLVGWWLSVEGKMLNQLLPTPNGSFNLQWMQHSSSFISRYSSEDQAAAFPACTR